MSLATVLTRRTALYPALAVVITLYGALLRLDCFVSKYGPLDHPAWARVATHRIAPLGKALRPFDIEWTRQTDPYVGGDPITYIEYGRAITNFYQAHVREPVFLTMTHAGLWAVDDQNVGVSLASATGSTLMIFATYLVGAAVLSPAVGLIAALLTATELEMVTWGVDGWRDDTFAATILFACWAMLRMRARPSFRSTVLTGVLCGLSCLTRITALTFILPALAWLVIDGDRATRVLRLKHVGLAALVMTVIVAPYLISCAVAYGDPLIAINYHTAYYRFAESRPIDQPMSAAEYLRSKFAARPLATLDTGINGLLVQPFVTKWHGFGHWLDGLGATLRAISIVGLAALPFFAAGRLVLVLLVGSLVPYMFTWNVGGGGAWRFTMHAYPFFFIGVGLAIVGAWRALRTLVHDRSAARVAVAPIVRRTAAVAVVAAVGTLWYFGMPWYVIRESIAKGEATSIETGSRDLVFYRSGWSAPHEENITVRVSLEERAVIRLPLPERRTYDLVLRLDPIASNAPEQVDVLFNRHVVGRFSPTTNPERVGSYRLRLREDIVNAGSNEVILVPSSMTPAGSAGPRFAWLNPTARLGVRLWYVRVLP
jgi:hypothetical protein